MMNKDCIFRSCTSIANPNKVVLDAMGASPTKKTSRMVPLLLVLSSMMAEVTRQVRRMKKWQQQTSL
jgi:hypothetical protein